MAREEDANAAIEILQDTPLGNTASDNVPLGDVARRVLNSSYGKRIAELTVPTTVSRQTRPDPRLVTDPPATPKQAQPIARPALYRAPRFISPSTGVCYEHDVAYNTPVSGVSYAPTRLVDVIERGEKRQRDSEAELESTNKYARITQFKKWLEDQGEGFLEDIAAGLGETLARTRIVAALLFLQGVFDV